MTRPAHSRRRVVVAVTAALLLIALLLMLDPDGDGDKRLLPGGGMTDEHSDPLAFRAEDAPELERRAAAGLSHVLYAKSPGGATASARRTAAWRGQIEAAATESNVDPELLEALVFVESAGRPEVIAGNDPEGAGGLTQILAETAVNLLGLRVDLAKSRALTNRLASAERDGNARKARRLRAARRRIDERFDPRKALGAAGRYLQIAGEGFGGEDLALASYHMGIGNLERVVRAYADVGSVPVGEVVRDQELTYTKLFFDSTPLVHADAYKLLARFGDDSSTYLWRVLAAREIMRLYRERPDELARLERLHERKNSAEEVLHPRGGAVVFESPDELTRARGNGDLTGLPTDSADSHFKIDPQMGELAGRVGEAPGAYRALRPEALALLLYMAAGVEAISGETPLRLTSTVRDREYQRVLGSRNREATRGYSLHTTGYSFDVLRRYRSRRQALAFQFWLDRLQSMNLIAWVREPAAIHVTVSSEAKVLLP